MSDPKSTQDVENVENETAAAEEQTANPFAVEDEADLEGSLENIDLDEEAEDAEAEAEDEDAEEDEDEGEDDEEAEYEGDLEYDEEGNPVEAEC